MYQGKINKIVIYSLLVIGVIISVLPFYWMANGSTLPSGKIMSVPPAFSPGDKLIENSQSLNNSVSFYKVMWNSLLIAVTSTVFGGLISAMAGYAFAKFEFFGKGPIFFIILATLMIPFQIVLIPLFEIIINLDWLNTYQAVILPTLASPFAVFLMRQNMQSVPTSIIESARIDGAGEFKIFFKIILPTMKSALTATGIFLFMEQWNSLLWPLVVLNSEQMTTFPVALSSLVGLARIDYGQVMLGATISVLPMLILFLIFQRNFVSGILGGSVKE